MIHSFQYQVNARYKGFIIERVITIDEIQTTLIELIHQSSGARVLHLAADDDENLFCLSFQTRPTSSNGIAHILEHTVLCGSNKYEVRDPFFSMTRRSLNTFMNAFTGADFTCYPAASCVEKDFYNLLDVYLDAVFHPRLMRLSFLQEGHRVEFVDSHPSLKEGIPPLTFKGVVYNEMKGAMSTPDARLDEVVMAELMPNLTYAVNSGGRPDDILNLTYDELKAFHSECYHPSRCLFFFYGNLPLEKHLDFIEEHALKKATKQEPLSPIPRQPRFKKSIKKTAYYPVTQEMPKEEQKALISFAWLTCSILDQFDLLALTVLELVLMATDASPLKYALLKSGLCKQAESSLEDEMSEIPWQITLRGCENSAGDKIEAFLLQTLTTIAQEGIPQHLIDGAIHQLEMARSEISAPFGLSLFFRACLLKQHGGKPEEALQIHTLFKRLREAAQESSFLGTLIHKYLIDNPHRVRIDLIADPMLQAKEGQKEALKLKELQKKLSLQEGEKIIEESLALKAYQESEENVEILPKIALHDVPTLGKNYPLSHSALDALQLHAHQNFTNGLLYADLHFLLPEVSIDELYLVRLFAFLLPQMGIIGRSYKEMLDQSFQHTGGISVDLDLHTHASDPKQMRPTLSLRGKSLYRKADRLFAILQEYATLADFTDVTRLKELMVQHYEDLEENIQTNSLKYAVMLGSSDLSIAGQIHELWYGLHYFWQIDQLLKSFDKQNDKLIKKLTAYKEKLLATPTDLVVSSDGTMLSQIIETKAFGISKLAKKGQTGRFDFALQPVESQARLTSSPVAFTAFVMPGLPYLHRQTTALTLAAKIMENKVLHKRIREQGGAYGSGAVHVASSGHFYFYGYRDPHILHSCQAFEEAIHTIVEGHFEPRDLHEAKLEIFGDLDAPIAPSSRAAIAFARQQTGRSDEARAAKRAELFDTSKEAICEVAAQFLKPNFAKGKLITFASKELVEKEGANLFTKTASIYNSGL